MMEKTRTNYTLEDAVTGDTLIVSFLDVSPSLALVTIENATGKKIIYVDRLRLLQLANALTEDYARFVGGK